MSEDTHIGGSSSRFPLTKFSAILGARSDLEEERTRAYGLLVSVYWKPVYKYIRIKWHKPNEDAKDLTQGFFAKAMEKGFFDRYDPARARFRTFLRTCVDGYVSNENKAADRIKRGGEATILPLDFNTAEDELQHDPADANQSVDALFENEWIRSLFSLSLEELNRIFESQGKLTYFLLFYRYDVLQHANNEKLSYAELAREYGIALTDVTNYLALARREFRRIVLEHLRSLTATEQEYREEARLLLGVEV